MNNAQEANINKSTPEITSVGIFEKLTQGNKMSKKSIALILSLLLTSSVLMGGCGGTSVSAENQPSTTVEQDESDVKVPKEASDFVEQYGDRYDDTETAVGAFFSLDAYSMENSCNMEHLNIMISQDDKDYYNEHLMGWWEIDREYSRFDEETMTNAMGFKLFKMSPEDSVESDKTAEKSMDNLIGPMTELMINYLIKNPDSESKEIIAWEYKKMCAMAGYDVNDYENGRDPQIVNSTEGYIERVAAAASMFKANQHLIYLPTDKGTEARCSGYTKTGEDSNGYDVRSQGIDATMVFKVESYDSNGEAVESFYNLEGGISTFIENGNNYLFFGS